jgi:SAM-dependent methyltransferase
VSLYDEIGRTYSATRREDPRIAAAIHTALGDARTVLNVGAGTGNYEPRDRDVTAVEPSAVMRAQRPPGAAPAIDGTAEALPFPDASFDATMAVLSDHHWPDRLGGLRELRRVAAERAVIFTFDPALEGVGWLVQDYLPGFASLLEAEFRIEDLAEALGGARTEVVPVPADCRDGFFHAWWARPEAYLDATVRAGISVFSKLDPDEVAVAMERLRVDLESGAWDRRHGRLRTLDHLDLGYRLLVAERL